MKTLYFWAFKYPDNYISTLREALECCNEYGLQPFIEIKTHVPLDKVYDVYQVFQYSHRRPIVVSGSVEILRHIRSFDKEIELMSTTRMFTDSYFEMCKEYRFGSTMHYSGFTYEMLQKMHREGLRVCVWIVLDKNMMEAFRNWGVDFITREF